MDAGTLKRVESSVCAAAAAVFAAAVGFAVYRWLEPGMVQSQLIALTGIGSVAAFVPCWQALAQVDKREPDFRVPLIDLGAVVPSRPSELLLTDDDRLADELLLEDVLPQIARDSRVVQLFDPSAMPTAGQLKERIDRHLERAPPDSPVDASQALYDALAELRIELPSRR
jgi:hypothetical protein